MYDLASITIVSTAIVSTLSALTRLARAVDRLSNAIAGFALLAGARTFTFIALFALREPVIGGAALVLLALVGWLRSQWCGGAGRPLAQLSSKKPHASCLLQSVSMHFKD